MGPGWLGTDDLVGPVHALLRILRPCPFEMDDALQDNLDFPVGNLKNLLAIEDGGISTRPQTNAAGRRTPDD